MIQVELVEVGEDRNLYPCPGYNNLTLRRGRQRQEAYPPLPWLLESKGKLVIHSLGQFGNLAGPGRPIHEAFFKGV